MRTTNTSLFQTHFIQEKSLARSYGIIVAYSFFLLKHWFDIYILRISWDNILGQKGSQKLRTFRQNLIGLELLFLF